MARQPRTINPCSRDRGFAPGNQPRCVSIALTFLVVSALSSQPCQADPQVSFADLQERYARHVQPLLVRHCIDCHSTRKKKGELDLEQFNSLVQVRGAPETWQAVAHMVQRDEMPPPGSKRIAPEQRHRLLLWLGDYLRREACASAGDPGPVVLRRMNNAEYTYTLRDLLGVNVDPAGEFPADGAAGEGFTNAGGALSMSPALLQKYLVEGKQIARHMVLLPDGFRFSTETTRRGSTDELLSQIRDFYADFVDTVDLGEGLDVGYHTGHVDTRLGRAGRLPLARYFSALL
ncbi:MAG: DUF1587 domain-containing protein, partial [Pirellulales bacterium]|nr:DUF1587 domain-containing protein [Pirellulales bacterium]